jgi:hypothetical protein
LLLALGDLIGAAADFAPMKFLTWPIWPPTINLIQKSFLCSDHFAHRRDASPVGGRVRSRDTLSIAPWQRSISWIERLQVRAGWLGHVILL